MNLTELFLVQMVCTYLQMQIQTNTKLTPEEKATITNGIAANQAIVLAFATPSAT